MCLAWSTLVDVIAQIFIAASLRTRLLSSSSIKQKGEHSQRTFGHLQTFLVLSCLLAQWENKWQLCPEENKMQELHNQHYLYTRDTRCQVEPCTPCTVQELPLPTSFTSTRFPDHICHPGETGAPTLLSSLLHWMRGLSLSHRNALCKRWPSLGSAV